MRVSSYIQYPEALGLLEARRRSEELGMPLNCWITLHLESVGIAPNLASLHFRQGLSRLQKYHKRQGLPFCALWVLESKNIVGVHAHVLVHRPRTLETAYRDYRKRLLECFRITNKKGSLRVEKVGGYPSRETNIERAVFYMLKGLRPEAAMLLGYNRIEFQGKVVGKRVGWTRNLATAHHNANEMK